MRDRSFFDLVAFVKVAPKVQASSSLSHALIRTGKWTSERSPLMFRPKNHSTHLLAATTLRNVLGTKHLAEILSERETISHVMEQTLDEATDPWGVKVERVEIKDVRLPVQLQRAMAAEAEAAREARAKVIAAEGEQKASRALREASDVISESPSALQLRYLQTLNTISAEKNSTIIFPVPLDIISHFFTGGKKQA